MPQSIDGLRVMKIRAADFGGGDRTILLVEDETFVREVTGEILRAAGYEVLSATTAAEGATIYAERGSEISLVITDIVLPAETGVTLAAALRRKTKDLKVLFITGYYERARNMNPEEFLAKPFSASILLSRVMQLLHEGEIDLPLEEFAMPAGVSA